MKWEGGDGVLGRRVMGKEKRGNEQGVDVAFIE